MLASESSVGECKMEEAVILAVSHLISDNLIYNVELKLPQKRDVTWFALSRVREGYMVWLCFLNLCDFLLLVSEQAC